MICDGELGARSGQCLRTSGITLLSYLGSAKHPVRKNCVYILQIKKNWKVTVCWR